MSKKMWTYVVRAVGVPFMKIGRSAYPKARLRALQTSSPVPLELVGTIEGDVEKELHERFAEAWSRNEWFEITSEIESWLQGEARLIAEKCRPGGESPVLGAMTTAKTKEEWAKLWAKELGADATAIRGPLSAVRSLEVGLRSTVGDWCSKDELGEAFDLLNSEPDRLLHGSAFIELACFCPWVQFVYRLEEKRRIVLLVSKPMQGGNVQKWCFDSLASFWNLCDCVGVTVLIILFPYAGSSFCWAFDSMLWAIERPALDKCVTPAALFVVSAGS